MQVGTMPGQIVNKDANNLSKNALQKTSKKMEQEWNKKENYCDFLINILSIKNPVLT